MTSDLGSDDQRVPFIERTSVLEKERKRRSRSVHFDNSDVEIDPDVPRPRPSDSTRRSHTSVAFRERPVAGQKRRSFWEERSQGEPIFERVPGGQYVKAIERHRQVAIPGVLPNLDPFTPPTTIYRSRSRANTRASDDEDSSESQDTWHGWDDANDELEWSDQESPVHTRVRQISEPEAPRKRVDIVYDPSQAKRDITVRLQMDIEEDVGLDLDGFCRLRRLGWFKDAKAQFMSKLEHFDSHYFRLLYAEMLLASGDYKSLGGLPINPGLLHPSRLGPDQPREDRYGMNWVDLKTTNSFLLGILSQRPEPLDVLYIQGFVRSTLETLSHVLIEYSTQVQVLAMCFRALQYLECCMHKSMLETEQESTLHIFDWKQVYQMLLGEGCVWDFRDLFVSAVPVFGWEAFTLVLFGTSSVDGVLDTIVDDWTGALYDEASTLGLLDLFTSLILQDLSVGAKVRNSLLLQEARALAESAQAHDEGLMRSRPFIQWLLAKSALEMEEAPEGPDGVRLEDFRGLLIYQGKDLHLPIYVPSRHTNKPTWEMLSKRSSPAARRAAEVAAAAAHHIGDYDLEAAALKLLILQSQDPKRWMDALAHLQLETQGDKEGYLATCLAKYLVSTGESEEAFLLRDMAKLGTERGMCENLSLSWAWDMIQAHLASSARGSGTGDKRNPVTAKFEETCNQRSWYYPRYIVDFARKELAISGSPHTPEFNSASQQPFGLDPAALDRWDHGHDVSELSRRHPGRPPPPPPPAPGSQGPIPEPTREYHEDMKRVWDGFKDRFKSPAVSGSPSQTKGRDGESRSLVYGRFHHQPSSQNVPRASSPAQYQRLRCDMDNILEKTEIPPSQNYKTSGQSHQTPRRQHSYDKVRGWLQIDSDREGEGREPAATGKEKNKSGRKNSTGKQETPGKGPNADKGPSGSSRERDEPTQNQHNNKAQHKQEHQSGNTGDNSPDAGNDEQQTRAEEKRDGNDSQNASITPSNAVDDEKHMQTEEDGNDNDAINASDVSSDASEDSQPMRVEEDQNGLTKLKFSRDLLEDNHMAVVVWDRKGLQKTKTYIVDEGGVSEAKEANPKKQSTGAAGAGTGGPSPTIRIRTNGDRIDTIDSGRSAGKQQSSIDGVKRIGGGEVGKLHNSQSEKREKRDRWDEFWFPPGKGFQKSEPARIHGLMPYHLHPDRAYNTATERNDFDGSKPNPAEKKEVKGKEKEVVVDRRASVAEDSEEDETSNDAAETVVQEDDKAARFAGSLGDGESDGGLTVEEVA